MVKARRMVKVGRGHPIPLEEALDVIAGYCFSTRPLDWSASRDELGKAPECVLGYFAYRSYDGVPASGGAELTDLDVLIANALNAGMDASLIDAVRALAPAVSAELQDIPESTKFWELERDDVVWPPHARSPSLHIWTAWHLLNGIKGVGVARSHKILHHKRPTVFPLMDTRTLGWLNEDENSWAQIHRELTEQEDLWVEMEERTARMAKENSMRAPRRLRLHDILLWCKASGSRWKSARKEGRTVRAGSGGGRRPAQGRPGSHLNASFDCRSC